MTTHARLIHDDLNRDLAGGDRVDTFFRLFDDSDGDGHVDARDLLRFGSTLGKGAGDPGYLWYFDYDGDGRVDLGDLLQVLRRFGQ
jgi:Ca2+-binding EF-hand superfamily protein